MQDQRLFIEMLIDRGFVTHSETSDLQELRDALDNPEFQQLLLNELRAVVEQTIIHKATQYA